MSCAFAYNAKQDLLDIVEDLGFEEHELDGLTVLEGDDVLVIIEESWLSFDTGGINARFRVEAPYTSLVMDSRGVEQFKHGMRFIGVDNQQRATVFFR